MVKRRAWNYNTATETDSIASSVGDSNGVYIVPAFTGLGAPYWDQYARGIIIELTRCKQKASCKRLADLLHIRLMML